MIGLPNLQNYCPLFNENRGHLGTHEQKASEECIKMQSHDILTVKSLIWILVYIFNNL